FPGARTCFAVVQWIGKNQRGDGSASCAGISGSAAASLLSSSHVEGGAELRHACPWRKYSGEGVDRGEDLSSSCGRHGRCGERWHGCKLAGQSSCDGQSLRIRKACLGSQRQIQNNRPGVDAPDFWE